MNADKMTPIDWMYISVAILVLFTLALVGVRTSNRPVLQTITYGGHDYIKSAGSSSGNILHSPDCPCHER